MAKCSEKKGVLGAGQLETTVIVISQTIYTHWRQWGRGKKELTKLKRITQGVTTSAAETAEMNRGGSLLSWRKVCLISGRG